MVMALYYIKKFAVSGVISTVLFSLFLYFVYSTEGAKNNNVIAVAAEKKYTLDAVSGINSIAAQIAEQRIAQKNIITASAPIIQKIQADSISMPTKTVPQTLPIPSLPAIKSSSPVPAFIAPIVIPSVPAVTSSQVRIAIPTPTVATPTPIPVVQPAPVATAPRTTVS